MQAICVKDISPNLKSCELLQDGTGTFQCKADVFLTLDSLDCLSAWAPAETHHRDPELFSGNVGVGGMDGCRPWMFHSTNTHSSQFSFYCQIFKKKRKKNVCEGNFAVLPHVFSALQRVKCPKIVQDHQQSVFIDLSIKMNKRHCVAWMYPAYANVENERKPWKCCLDL